MRLTTRKCYVCGRANNPVVIVERPIEERFGASVLPASAYELAMCRNCKALYVDCDVTDEFLESLYRRESISWQKAFLGQGETLSEPIGSGRVPEFEAHWRTITAIRTPSVGDNLLDVGCQTGEFGSIAKRDGVIPHGVELSADYARRALELWGGDSTVLSEPLTSSSFAGRQFQYVTAFETLEHMADPRATLRRIRGLTDPTGVVAISVPSTHYFWLKFKLLHGLRKQPLLFRLLIGRRSATYLQQILPHTHLFNFSPRALTMLAEQAGFTVVSVYAVGWKGRSTSLELLCDAIMNVSGRRYGLAPSLLAIARPA